MNSWFKLALCVWGAIGQTIESWIGGQYPSSLSKTMALVGDVSQLMSGLGSRHVVVILPSNDAWKSHKDLYNKLQSSPNDRYSMLLDAVVEVPGVTTLAGVKSLNDISFSDVYTLAGTPVVKDKGKYYYGQMSADGSTKKSGKPIEINKTPLAAFDNVAIFQAKTFALPPALRQ
ncbi:hypothetical protein GNI_033910 [Gregarina niphandrodes]|uniref:FAS1 domain-containing protein n=1 Tax=Gregarina niphandrodes TaxID=110365 RepID=A0A023BAU9_GRENI|nr:hypothetical protein GNI_033910 [Gregarina niphandrodes]EZG78636.1 hypothetical protein GNI_033910 [Gregarina niphandrodes]|eukprot:XP_011129227.1 hypothetical protein GNI_033910 [Gregarina niphandrodes]